MNEHAPYNSSGSSGSSGSLPPSRARLNNPVGARTDEGCVREHNEDSLIVLPPLYAVADGMGGHFGGEVASEIAVQSLADSADTLYDAESLADAIAKANTAIIEAAEESLARSGMGTTVTAAIVVGSDLLIAQVGDSRAYLLSGASLRQLTVDHSFVAELVATGQITEEEAAIHPKRSMITRALGSYNAAQPDLYTVPLELGDRILLCSDGLSGMVSDEVIRDILLAHRDPQQATDELIYEARAAGGLDNITAVVIDIAELDDEGSGKASDEKTFRSKRVQSSRGARHKKRGMRLGIITFVVLFLLLVAGAVGGVYLYANNVAFLRIEDGYVQVYRGLNGEVLPGIKLEWHERQTNVTPTKLTPNLAKRLEAGVQVSSLDEANSLVAGYEKQIASSNDETAGVAA